MSDRPIEPMDAFEARLARRLRAASDHALRAVDPAAVARDVALAHPRGWLRSIPGWWLTRSRQRERAAVLVFATLSLIVAILAAALLIGSRPRPPSVHLGHLAYTLANDVYVADWDGRHAVKVTSASGAPGSGFDIPRWYGATLTMSGPDARDPTVSGLFVLERAGGGIRELGPDAFNFRFDAARSVDGRRYAFIAGSVLTIADLAGSSNVLRPPPGHPIWDNSDLATMSWSPDGAALLAGGCTVDPCDKSPYATHDLFFVPLDGGSPQPLSSPDTPAWHARVSPDGAEIAYMACHADTSATSRCGSYYLGIMRRDGSDRRVLVDTNATGRSPGFQYHWSPDSRQIAYTFGDASGTLGLWVADAARHMPPSQLMTGPAAPLGWSPDGRLILATHVDGTGGSSLWAVPTDGSASTELVRGATSGDWEWVPDGALDPFGEPNAVSRSSGFAPPSLDR
jgi:hypothetical protein